MKNYVLHLVALGLIASSTAAVAGDQFDLKCSGTRTRGVSGAPESFQQVIHVDLIARSYCYDDCKATLAIDDVQLDVITFRNRTDQVSGEVDLAKVNRVSGAYESLAILPRFAVYTKMNEQCSPAPFTPFPATKF